MEPLNGTALVTKERVDVWHPVPAFADGLLWSRPTKPASHPRTSMFHQTYVGGGFGRRVFSDDARMVVAVAKHFPAVPVHVIWSREEATRQGRYRPLMAAKLKAGLGADGMPTAFHGRMSGGPGFFVNGHGRYRADLHAAERSGESQVLPLHIRTGPYRGPGYNSNRSSSRPSSTSARIAAGIDPAGVPPQAVRQMGGYRLGQDASPNSAKKPAGARSCPRARVAASRFPTGACAAAPTPAPPAPRSPKSKLRKDGKLSDPAARRRLRHRARSSTRMRFAPNSRAAPCSDST